MKQNAPVVAIVGAVIALAAFIAFMAYRAFAPQGVPIPPEIQKVKGDSAAGALPPNWKEMTPQQKREYGMRRMGGGPPAAAPAGR